MAQINLITNIGRQILTGALAGATTGPGSALAKYIGLGNVNAAAAQTDTALNGEFGTRVAGTLSQATTSVANDTYKCVGTVSVGSSQTIYQAGVFDASANGNLFLKTSFDVISLSAGDSIAVTFQYQVS